MSNIFFLIFSFVAIFAFTFSYFTFLVPAIFSQEIPIASKKIASTVTSGHDARPLSSNQWYSNIYKSFPTSPLYALPLSYRLSEKGVEVSYPIVKSSSEEITAPFQSEMSIGTGNGMQRAKLTTIGDWHVKAALSDGSGNELQATMGHGMPFISVASSNPDLQITLNGKYTIKNNNEEVITEKQNAFSTDNFLIKTPTSSYIVLLPKMTTVAYKNNALSIANTQDMTVALLDSENNYLTFKDLRNIKITDSQTYPTFQDNKLYVQFKLSSEKDATPMIALYPHQYDNLLEDMKKIGEYRSIRGPLNLYKASSFTTTTALKTPESGYRPVKQNAEALKQQIRADIQEIMQKGPPSDKVYTQGAWFGKVGTLLLLADAHGLETEKQQLLTYIKPIFYNSLKSYSYNKNDTSLVANNSEFGNNELNDHHFHYGYYIRFAAILGGFDYESVNQTSKTIDEMVKDIATINRQDANYPYLRNFDIYESHSWADGYGNSPLGNNQESSSEAINAWYGLYLWGQLTKNANLTQYALYLYNSEITGAKYYWFDQNDIYAPPYKHAIASQVWGGKVSFTTWFSGETNMKYGIQLLPLTPASDYLGTLENFDKYENDFTQSGGDVSDGWGDLYVAWKSFYNGQEALKTSALVNDPEGNTPKSNFLYLLYQNAK